MLIRKCPVWIVCALPLILALGCATPVGVMSWSDKAVYRQLNGSVLTTGKPSPFSKQFLERLSLRDRFKKRSRTALATLHAGLGGLDEHDRLFALAELSYLHADRYEQPQYFLASALYAWLFLFPENQEHAPISFDPRLRLAMDIYNLGITHGLRDAKTGKINLAPRRLPLPFGSLELSIDPSDFVAGDSRLLDFTAVEGFRIRGLRNRYRRPGIGAALSARTDIAERPERQPQFANSKVPVTALVRFNHPRRSLSEGHITGGIELYDADLHPAIVIEGQSVPLESDPTTALAYTLEDSALWDFELAGFRRGDFNPFNKEGEGELYLARAYRPGRIPVVFVHGTASSPARWAEMINEFLGDSNIARHYQAWFFLYNSGNPVALSAMHLREKLQRAVKDLDPEGRDQALRNMVVIGHSQGGLLTKMTVVRSESKFWDNVTKDSFDKADLSPETKDLLRRSLFIEPLPFVRRVVFIATPHQGSYMAEDFIGKIGRRFINLPASLGNIGLELIKLNPVDAARKAIHLPTAIDNMDHTNPFLKTLSALPISPDVKSHSIIPVMGKGPIAKGEDGVVRYSSAHIEGVESELVVRSGHSCQSNPKTIEETRRILYVHAGIQ